MKSNLRPHLIILSVIIVSALGLFACNDPETSDQSTFLIGVFVPGIVEGSPTYEMLVDGVKKAVEDKTAEGIPVQYQVFEAGFNQAEWPSSLTSLVASETYDLIVTSNPSMPEIVTSVLNQFPDQKFLILDGYLEGNPRIKTIYFNQFEQAFLAGYLAGLITGPDSGLSGSKPEKRIALLAGQEYPVMNNQIRPGFLAGARAVDPEISLDFRVLGNWFDAGKAADLVRSTITSGADVVLTIAGGGNQGAIAAAAEAGTYVLWYDSPGYSYGPGTVLGSTVVRQEEFAYRATLKAIEGNLDFGVPEIHGIQDGAVGFDFDSPEYRTFLPMDLRVRFENSFREFETGEQSIPSPKLF